MEGDGSGVGDCGNELSGELKGGIVLLSAGASTGDARAAEPRFSNI